MCGNVVFLGIKRFEDEGNRVVLYFTELNNEPVCVPFIINENAVVTSRADAAIKLYDYYNPELQISTVSCFIQYIITE